MSQRILREQASSDGSSRSSSLGRPDNTLRFETPRSKHSAKVKSRQASRSVLVTMPSAKQFRRSTKQCQDHSMRYSDEVMVKLALNGAKALDDEIASLEDKEKYQKREKELKQIKM